MMIQDRSPVGAGCRERREARLKIDRRLASWRDDVEDHPPFPSRLHAVPPAGHPTQRLSPLSRKGPFDAFLMRDGAVVCMLGRIPYGLDGPGRGNGGTR